MLIKRFRPESMMINLAPDLTTCAGTMAQARQRLCGRNGACSTPWGPPKGVPFLGHDRIAAALDGFVVTVADLSLPLMPRWIE
jgi:hypothetical protein